jgi:alcohol dehydrogenase class IV
MKHNAETAKKLGDQNLLARFAELAQMLTGEPGGASEVVDWAIEISAEVGIGKLSDHGFVESHIPELVPKAQNASSMKGNPVELGANVLEQILREAL